MHISSTVMILILPFKRFLHVIYSILLVGEQTLWSGKYIGFNKYYYDYGSLSLSKGKLFDFTAYVYCVYIFPSSNVLNSMYIYIYIYISLGT